jgi:hypothetical protein
VKPRQFLVTSLHRSVKTHVCCEADDKAELADRGAWAFQHKRPPRKCDRQHSNSNWEEGKAMLVIALGSLLNKSFVVL